MYINLCAQNLKVIEGLISHKYRAVNPEGKETAAENLLRLTNCY